MTGIMDNKLVSTSKDAKEILEQLKDVSIQTNKEFSKRLGIPQSAAITCVKPSGTVSQLVDASSGFILDIASFIYGQLEVTTKTPSQDS